MAQSNGTTRDQIVKAAEANGWTQDKGYDSAGAWAGTRGSQHVNAEFSVRGGITWACTDRGRFGGPGKLSRVLAYLDTTTEGDTFTVAAPTFLPQYGTELHIAMDDGRADSQRALCTSTHRTLGCGLLPDFPVPIREAGYEWDASRYTLCPDCVRKNCPVCGEPTAAHVGQRNCLPPAPNEKPRGLYDLPVFGWAWTEDK